MLLQVNSSNFQEEVLNNSERVFVAFLTDWSGPSKTVKPILEELALEMEGRVHFVQLNMDECPDVVYQYQVTSAPTFVLFVGGQVFDKIVGYLPKSGFENFFRKNS